MDQLVSKKIKKKRIVRLMILLSVTFVLTVFTSCQNAQKPFKALSVESIAKVEIAFPTEGTNSVIVLNGEESQRIVEALNGLTTTGKNDETYYGTWWEIRIANTDDSKILIGESGYDKVTVNGVGYHWTKESFDCLNEICTELHKEYLETENE